MAFNHYARLKQIIEKLLPGWYIVRIDKPTVAKSFKGEARTFDHYYRIYSVDGQAVRYGKFQQIDLLAKTLGVVTESLTVIDDRAERLKIKAGPK